MHLAVTTATVVVGAIVTLLNFGVALVIVGAGLGYWAAFQFMQARASLRELDNMLEARANRAQEVIDHNDLTGE